MSHGPRSTAYPQPVAGAIHGYAARARRAQVVIKTDAHTYAGTLYVPDGKKRVSDVLCDDRPFVNLTEVSIDGAQALEPFLALNKTVIHSVRIVAEAPADVVPIRMR